MLWREKKWISTGDNLTIFDRDHILVLYKIDTPDQHIMLTDLTKLTLMPSEPMLIIYVIVTMS
jgi:hypothetical protein